MSATKQIAEFVAGNRGPLPETARTAGLRVLRDTIACAAAATRTDLGAVVERLLEAQGSESGSARVIGTGQRTSSLMAAYANGRLANVLDFDETYMMLGHHSHSALAATLALAAERDLDGAQALEAFVVGYEVGARVGRFVGDPLASDPATGTANWTFPGSPLATYAACAAAAVALGLNADEVMNAFGICAQYLPSDVNVWDDTGSVGAGMHSLKYEDNGWTAHTGLMAALVAAEGVTASKRMFDDPEGVARKVRPDSSPSAKHLLGGLGETWAIERTSLKPWPSCRWFHYPLTALAAVLRDHEIGPHEIEAVELQSVRNCIIFASAEIGESLLVDAQFSLPHSVAMLALGIEPGLAWFDPAVVHGAAASQLRRKVTVALHPEADDLSAWGHADEVRVPSRAIVHARGEVYQAEADRALGDPALPTDPPGGVDVDAKFDRLLCSLLPTSVAWRDNVVRLRERLAEFDELGSVDEVLAATCPRTAARASEVV
ncbi:MAG: hypothetical protein V7607_4490 [Solirubrobacteraceae bacterium]